MTDDEIICALWAMFIFLSAMAVFAKVMQYRGVLWG